MDEQMVYHKYIVGEEKIYIGNSVVRSFFLATTCECEFLSGQVLIAFLCGKVQQIYSET